MPPSAVTRAHADVVHAHALVHGREAVGLGDDHQVAGRGPLAHVVRQRRERHRLGEARARLVGEQAEAGAGHDADLLVGDLVLAVAEEDEVVLEQPVQERDRLVDLVVGVDDGPGAGQMAHPPRRGRPSPGSRARPRGPARARCARRPRRSASVSAGSRRSRSKCMTDSRVLASRGCSTAAMRPSPLRSTPMIGCSTRCTRAPVRLQLGGHRVDQERPVLGVRLDHRPVRLVAVVLGAGVARPHRDRVRAAAVGELEQPVDLAEQRLDRRLVDRVGREPPQVGLRELLDHRRPVRSDPLVDEREQLVADRSDLVLARVGDAHTSIIARVRFPCTVRSWRACAA